MKLPRHGLLVRADGTVVWAWAHNDPNTDFDALPPMKISLDGSAVAFVADPADSVLDLEAEELEPEVMIELVHDRQKMRMRKRSDGSLRLTRIIGQDAQGADVEVDHPIVDIINLQRDKKGKARLKKGEDV